MFQIFGGIESKMRKRDSKYTEFQLFESKTVEKKERKIGKKNKNIRNTESCILLPCHRFLRMNFHTKNLNF